MRDLGSAPAMAAPAPQLQLRAASLFDVDPELGDLLAPRQLVEARVRAIVATIELPAGAWSPEQLRRLPTTPFALLVLDGLVVRELLLGGSTATELLGACDVVDLGPPEDALLPAEARWSVPEAARVAVLDDRVLTIVRAWPSVARVLLDRAARRGARLATHRAIAQLPRVDQRLMAFFGHLAERWGRVAPAGVVIPLHLTHETLGRLIGARRPTVSLALKELAASGVLERRSDGAWVLSYEAFQALRAGDAEVASWQPADARPVHAEAERAAPSARDRRLEAYVRADDITALESRLGVLRAQHETRLAMSTALLERSRLTRAEAREVRDKLRAAPPRRHGGSDGTGPSDELSERRRRRIGH
jgi:CRP/FNR family transcriptional regulator, cyclic AMP receptor protein